MLLTRQHDRTEIKEFEDKICEKLFAVGSNLNLPLTVMFILVNGVWHRFFIDLSVLFWEEGIMPDPEEDLCAGDRYIDLLCDCGIKNNAIKNIKV